MKNLIYKSSLVFIIFFSTSIAVTISTSNVALSNYKEECEFEGCENDELEELYDSYIHECFSEGCYVEEVDELTGYDSTYRDSYDGRSYNVPGYQTMLESFSERLGKDRKEIVNYRGAETPNAIIDLFDIIDGTVITVECDIDSEFNPDC